MLPIDDVVGAHLATRFILAAQSSMFYGDSRKTVSVPVVGFLVYVEMRGGRTARVRRQ